MLATLKILFLIIVAIHGLIHLMGFVKAFKFAELEQLTQPISKSLGLIWLTATLLFLVIIPVYLSKKDWWWMIALVAIVTSQLVIFFSWQDAKFGTIANVIILVVAVLGYGQWNFKQKTANDVQKLTQLAQANTLKAFSFKELDALPAPVVRYFRFALKDGQPITRMAKIHCEGEFSLGDKWIPFTSKEYFSSAPSGFIWDADMEMNALMNVRVRDAYFQKKGSMLGKLYGLYTIVDAHDDQKLTEGALQRYLAESAWLPTALLPSEHLKWTAIDENRALATLTDKGITVSLEFSFNEKGEITEVFAPVRFKEVNGEYKPFPWSGRFWNYKEIDGMMIPLEGEVEWQMPEGNLPYWKGQIVETEYDFVP